MPETFNPPTGPPPSRPVRSGSIDDTIPDEPPPAYTTVAGHQGDTTLAAGPSRMDFSGPPPLPDRMQANITGVGVGYEPRVYATSSHTSTPGETGMSAQPTGSSFHSNNPFGDHNRPAPPPHHPARYDSHGSFAPPQGPPPGAPGKNPPMSSTAGTGGFGGSPSSSAGPSRPPLPPSSTSSPVIDLSPTEIPTPGRPLLRHGQMLVYPKGHFCHKCGNTGYKANDPSNPHDADWRKYGKPYNAALAASYKTSTGPNSNPSLQSSANFQRPLPALPSAPQHHPPPQSPYGNLPPPPPPGKWNTYPGQHGYRPPPPPQPMPGGYGPPPIIGSFSTAIPPPNAIILQPGDPRIGGRPCWNCGGSGREIGFFGFDEGKCYQCRGIGRVF